MIHQGDCREILPTLSADSVDCIVTSPPYFGLRDYGVEGQIGMETTPDEYVATMVDVFREVRRVLKPTGTLWLNLGDSYSGSGRGYGSAPDPKWQGARRDDQKIKPSWDKIKLPPKNLIMIPARVALALQADGWILRQDIIWAKSNPMPESVRDRCTKSHEHIFLLAKSPKYYFDAEAIAEPTGDDTSQRGTRVKSMTTRYGGKKYAQCNDPRYRTKSGKIYDPKPRRNKRDVWYIPTKPYTEAHFATYPPELIRPCILAGCPLDGVVLDPFTGSGTTGQVAHELGRRFVGVELNPEYVEIATHRISPSIQTTIDTQ